ncbi:DUF6165 family protein [Shimia sp. SDUM112013]|uniref:DUF6165 family protein n=1 Tax=Shimia sp. SDUM112013 TaxID=3136160 RepID=UPI0032EFE2E6
MRVIIPVSVGDFVDRLSILRLKLARLPSPEQRANAQTEFDALNAVAPDIPPIPELLGALDDINATLWEVEDRLRVHEADGVFDDGFVALARSVYRLNDRRAALKKQINLRVGSDLIEEKSYGA